ncbi:hypothetical protein KY332_01645 [Candidatus Woesearchaeota archaeon]|nr:hypothetical protein [Candidatus Woesearchaeota archaeon]
MKYHADEDGNLVEEPENLVDRLELASPEYSDKLASLMNWKANFMTYKHFLYSSPSKEEHKREGRPNWEKYIQAIGFQQGFMEAFPMLDKREKRDLTDDLVAVVQSDRPFLDTLNSEKKIGKCQGWIGRVESYQITDMEDSEIFSHDGTVHQRFILNNARKLTEKELKEWDSAHFTQIVFHDQVQGIWDILDKIEKKPKGDKRVMLYDKYPNIDYYVLKHELSEDEKAVEHIDYEDACSIDLLPYYGEKQIKGSQFVKAMRYKDSKDIYGQVLIGEDRRKIKTIYNEINKILASAFEDVIKETSDLEEIHMQIVKGLDTCLTQEQREKAKDQHEPIKWYKKFIDDQGMKLTSKTIINISILRGREFDRNIEAKINKKLESALSSRGYVLTSYDLNYGWDSNYWGMTGCPANLFLDTSTEIAWDPGLYLGELLIKKP